MSDDRLRFGDAEAGGGGSENMLEKYTELGIQMIILAVVLFVLWKVLATLLPLM